MRPAWSVILLTTLIGVGQGLFLALFAVQVAALLGALPPTARQMFYAQGALLTLLFLGLGLAASFFHLGRPERAWRTATMWRSSWLSREVIALPAFMAAVSLYALAQLGDFNPTLSALGAVSAIDARFLLGALGCLLSLALFICTGMIYACMRFLREWATPLTVLNFTLLGCASGFGFAAAFAAMVAPELLRFLAGFALAFTLLAGAGRVAALARNAKLRPMSTLQTAIGIKHPNIVQKDMGFMGGSFNTREFFHGRSDATLQTVRSGFLAAAFVAPALLLALGFWRASSLLLAAAFATQYLGLLAERWYFFAQANHPQNLYYQAQA